MEKFVFKKESSDYIGNFINEIRNEVLNYQNSCQEVTLFVDPETELAEFKFDYYHNEDMDLKEIYGGANRNLYNTVIELFQWITSSKKFSSMDYAAIQKIRDLLTEYFRLYLPKYKDEVDYCYAIIESEN